MSVETGHAALWLAVAFAGLGAWRAEWARAAAVAAGVCAGVALWALARAFVQADFSVAAVRDGVNLGMSAEARLGAMWAGGAGLWLTAVGVAGLVLLPLAIGSRWFAAGYARRLNQRWAVALFGLGVIVLAVQPFARLDPAPGDGIGLSPALRAAGPDGSALLMLAGACPVIAFGLASTLSKVRRSWWMRWAGAIAWGFTGLVLLADLFAEDAGGIPLLPPLLLLASAAPALFGSRRLRALNGGRSRPFETMAWAGVVLVLIGFTGRIAGRDEAVVALSPDGTGKAGGWSVQASTVPVAGAGYSAVRADMTVSRGEQGWVLSPERRTYFAPEGAVSPESEHDALRVSLSPGPNGKWLVRIIRTPLQPFSYAGIALFGAALAFAMFRAARARLAALRRYRTIHYEQFA